MKKRLLKKLALVFTICCAMVLPVGCNKSSTPAYAGEDSVAAESYEAYADVDYGYAENSVDASGAVETTSMPSENLSTNRKLIKNVSMDVETENFDEFIALIETKTSLLGGYIAKSDIYFGDKYDDEFVCNAHLEIRVPERYLDSFIGEVGNMCSVVEKTMATDDVTLQYVDTQGQKNMFLAEEQSLLALLEKAENLEDITYLNSRLSEVRYQIENTESRLRTYDNLVDYATVKLNVSEQMAPSIQPEEEKGFWAELFEDFMNSLESVALIFITLFRILVVTLPYLFTIAVLAGVFVLAIKIIKAIMKKKNKKMIVSKEETE